MSRKKRSKIQVEKDRREIANLYLQGIIQAEIGARLGMTQPMVCYDIKVIKKRWLASSVRDFDEAKARELARIDNVETVAWRQFELSQGDKKSTTVKKSEGGTEATKKIEERLGDPRYLKIVLDCVDRRCKILGVDAPVKQDIAFSGGVVFLPEKD